jgi:hypothetical protein
MLVKGTGYKVQGATCLPTGSGTRYKEYKVQGTRYKVQGTE